MSIKRNQYVVYGVGAIVGCLMGAMALQPLQASNSHSLDPSVQLSLPQAGSYQSEATSPTIRIDRPRVNLRSGPGTSYSIVGRAVANQQYNVVGINADSSWYEIAMTGGQNAWVFAGIVELSGDLNAIGTGDASASATSSVVTTDVVTTDAATTDVATTAEPASASTEASTEAASVPATADSATTPTVTIARTRVNLRGGPGTGYAVVGNASADETYAVSGRNAASSWYEITLANGDTAWIYSAIVELSGDINSVQAKSPVSAAATTTTESTTTDDTATAATASTASASPAPAPVASTAGLRGRLLYSVANMDAERWELWEYNLGTGNSTKINDWWTEIDVSKDSSQVVYFAWPESAGDEAGIWIMDRDYTNNRLVIPGGAYPSFSPGGDRLVLNGGQDIYVINTDGGGLRGLTRGEYPAWNPVNDQVVHRACVGGGCGLWIIDANSNDPNARSRVTTGGSDGQPSWSPNGQRIAYISQDDGNFEIYVINADGSGKTRLTTDPASDGLPVWSPDGQWIAFRSDRGGSWAIYAMRPDGSDLRKIIDADVLPVWFFEKMDWY